MWEWKNYKNWSKCWINKIKKIRLRNESIKVHEKKYTIKTTKNELVYRLSNDNWKKVMTSNRNKSLLSSILIYTFTYVIGNDSISTEPRWKREKAGYFKMVKYFEEGNPNVDQAIKKSIFNCCQIHLSKLLFLPLKTEIGQILCKHNTKIFWLL